MACVAIYETLVLLINSCGATCFKKLFSLVSPVNQVIFFTILWLLLFLYWFNFWIDRYLNCFMFYCPLLMLPSVFFREVTSPVFAFDWPRRVGWHSPTSSHSHPFWHGGISHLASQVSCLLLFYFPSHAKSSFLQVLLHDCIRVGVSDQAPFVWFIFHRRLGFPRYY